jgi:hypothetical protein
MHRCVRVRPEIAIGDDACSMTALRSIGESRGRAGAEWSAKSRGSSGSNSSRTDKRLCRLWPRYADNRACARAEFIDSAARMRNSFGRDALCRVQNSASPKA